MVLPAILASESLAEALLTRICILFIDVVDLCQTAINQIKIILEGFHASFSADCFTFVVAKLPEFFLALLLLTANIY